jgi:hypothetical protein
MGLNFLKKNDSDREQKLEAPSGHNLSVQKQPFGV